MFFFYVIMSMVKRMEEEYKLTFKKVWGHLGVVNRHRWKVFCLCCKVGIPWRGLVHDLSKYTPVEFLETARYFDKGKFSPIKKCKEVNGYSMAWIHHKNHNKHWNQGYQLEYWNRIKVKAKVHPTIEKLLDKIYLDVSKEGLDPVLKRKRLKKLYDEYTKQAE